MNPIFTKIIINSVLNRNNGNKKQNYSEAELNKKLNSININIKRIVIDILFIILSVFAAGFGLKGFLLPNNFIDGGAMGISLLISEISSIPLSYLIVLVNFPFILLGIKVINKTFAVKTILSILALAAIVAFFPFPQITSDKLLISIFGGFFLGAGIGFAIRGGAVIDGTEILSIFISRRLGSSIGDIIFIINALIFLFAAYLLSIETAMYAMLTYLSASKTVDFIIEGFEEYMGITIITPFHEEVQNMLRDNLKKGFTVYKQKKGSGKKGENSSESYIVFTVVTRLEIGKLYSEIEKIDSDAFIITQSVKNIKGGLVKKRPLDEH